MMSHKRRTKDQVCIDELEKKTVISKRGVMEDKHNAASATTILESERNNFLLH